METVMKALGDQCCYGLKAKGKHGDGPARKATRFMTNSPCVALQFQRRCPNKSRYTVHRHAQLQGGKTRATQVCPPRLCQAICQRLVKQIEVDKVGQFLLMKKILSARMEHKCKTIEEDHNEELEIAWDDVSRATLNPQQVKWPRAEEIKYVRDMKFYDQVLTTKCYSKTKKTLITTRWRIDINKSDVAQPNYKSRLVAREINTYKRDDLFAATPPFETFKLILSMTAIANKSEFIMVNDISMAFFHALVKKEIYIKLPPEDTDAGEEELCGRLRSSMYGTRDAA